MKFNEIFLMKHQGTKARDLEFAIDVDTDAKTVVLNVDWIDTGLIDWTLAFGLLSTINSRLESDGFPKLKDLNGFEIELVVSGKARFSLRRVDRDFEPSQPTLVMHLKD